MPTNCTRCDQLKPHSDFYSEKLADVTHSICTECSLAILKANLRPRSVPASLPDSK